MTPSTSTRLGAAALLLGLVAACAGNGPATTPAPATPAPAPAAPPPPPVVAAPAPAAPDVSTLHPVVLEFDKGSIALSDDARATIARLADRGKAARRIVVTGYAGRAQGATARETGVARAAAVRNELTKVGVPAARIRVMYLTSQPRHAAEIEFEDGTPPRGR